MRRTRVWGAAAGAGVLLIVGTIAGFGLPRLLEDRNDWHARPDDRAAAYVQTWERSYSDTNCAQWKHEMTEQERFAGAADILVSAWQKFDSSADFPSDSLIRQFRNSISLACANPAHSVSDVAYAVYVGEADTYQP